MTAPKLAAAPAPTLAGRLRGAGAALAHAPHPVPHAPPSSGLHAAVPPAAHGREVMPALPGALAPHPAPAAVPTPPPSMPMQGGWGPAPPMQGGWGAPPPAPSSGVQTVRPGAQALPPRPAKPAPAAPNQAQQSNPVDQFVPGFMAHDKRLRDIQGKLNARAAQGGLSPERQRLLENVEYDRQKLHKQLHNSAGMSYETHVQPHLREGREVVLKPSGLTHADEVELGTRAMMPRKGTTEQRAARMMPALSMNQYNRQAEIRGEDPAMRAAAEMISQARARNQMIPQAIMPKMGMLLRKLTGMGKNASLGDYGGAALLGALTGYHLPSAFGGQAFHGDYSNSERALLGALAGMGAHALHNSGLMPTKRFQMAPVLSGALAKDKENWEKDPMNPRNTQEDIEDNAELDGVKKPTILAQHTGAIARPDPLENPPAELTMPPPKPDSDQFPKTAATFTENDAVIRAMRAAHPELSFGEAPAVGSSFRNFGDGDKHVLVGAAHANIPAMTALGIGRSDVSEMPGLRHADHPLAQMGARFLGGPMNSMLGGIAAASTDHPLAAAAIPVATHVPGMAAGATAAMKALEHLRAAGASPEQMGDAKRQLLAHFSMNHLAPFAASSLAAAAPLLAKHYWNKVHDEHEEPKQASEEPDSMLSGLLSAHSYHEHPILQRMIQGGYGGAALGLGSHALHTLVAPELAGATPQQRMIGALIGGGVGALGGAGAGSLLGAYEDAKHTGDARGKTPHSAAARFFGAREHAQRQAN